MFIMFIRLFYADMNFGLRSFIQLKMQVQSYRWFKLQMF